MRLIVGSGVIGQGLSLYWGEENTCHHTSTRIPEQVADNRPFINLLAEPELANSQQYETAVLCAGISSILECKNDPIGTRKVNVEGLLRLARYLSGLGTQVIFLSTDKVYDGIFRYRSPEDEVSPVTEYGMQKAEAEKGILELANGVVMRVAKVVHPYQSLLADWMVKLKAGQIIFPFSDMWFAPVSMNFVCRTIDRLIERRVNGIWHVSSMYEITYQVAAFHIAECLGVSTENIKAHSYREIGRAHDEAVPRYTSLDMEKTSRLGIYPEDPIETIHKSICLSWL